MDTSPWVAVNNTEGTDNPHLPPALRKRRGSWAAFAFLASFEGTGQSHVRYSSQYLRVNIRGLELDLNRLKGQESSRHP